MEKELIDKIESLRGKMELEAVKLGINHPSVIEISQKIDKFHTKLVKLQMEKRYRQKENSSKIFEKLVNTFDIALL
ncbi:hypothetical protein BHF71_01830 [Vulcanibacillus modesticaldus]|uniref:Sporulation protein Spo0E n=1 Tax=Vulcanibacillus modesticaldus TaxID=337097 RepID=A0A1D2YUG5_9BACI|nr:aspartyl-phosphate phosphatase Spo0E family protein [Vulcanibacillus modesticaldus]OEF99352.1 hypothetical protein BHF71_01830 [Vulcanibacillus modesticaldus]